MGLVRLVILLAVSTTACGSTFSTGSSDATGESCPAGHHDSGGHCCLEGAEWVPARSRCICLEPSGCEQPPSTAELDVDATASQQGPADSGGDCLNGKVHSNLTAGHCCWPEQSWSEVDSRCSGTPDCPEGLLLSGDDCTVGEITEWEEIAAGSYSVGSPEGEPDRFSDERLHKVTLSRPFRMKSTEVTQGEFESVMGYNPSRFADCGERCPVERVSWHEAAVYSNALSEQQGLEPCYTCRGAPPQTQCVLSNEYASPYQCSGFRLPTETEWEIAVRSGNPGPRHGTDVVRIAWYRGNSGGSPRNVASREPNAWGLFDLLGNVMEWCHDWYGEYPSAPQIDPTGPRRGTIRVLRGGSWLINAERVRAAYRYRFAPETRLSYVGFRVVQTIDVSREAASEVP